MPRLNRIALAAAVAGTLGFAALPAAGAAAADAGSPSVRTVLSFDPAALETPENIVVDDKNTLYVSLALTGEIRVVTAAGKYSTLARLPLGAPPLTVCGPFFAGVTGITLDARGTLYANLASCDPASRGVWAIPSGGQPRRIAGLPVESLPNGIVANAGYLYIADSSLGRIWRVPQAGGTPTVWADGPALAVTGSGLPGPNGLKLFDGELYVSNPSQATVVAITVGADGAAGAARTHASGVFCDDFAFAIDGDLYCGTDPFNTLERISPDGTAHTVLTGADGLDGPTAVAFGHQGDRFTLYVTNGAFPFFPGPTPRRPSVLSLTVDSPGFPNS